jgi:hypothetical protein
MEIHVKIHDSPVKRGPFRACVNVSLLHRIASSRIYFGIFIIIFLVFVIYGGRTFIPTWAGSLLLVSLLTILTIELTRYDRSIVWALLHDPQALYMIVNVVRL